MHDAVKEHARTPFREEVWEQLAEGFRFVPGHFDDDDAFDQLAETIEELDEERGTGGNHAFYLSIPPEALPDGARAAGRSGLADAADGGNWRRVVIEKPFGHDLQVARASSTTSSSDVFPPDSVFRIDHYLGKETVQNILALRFANPLFEPIWNANYVDHVQITMAEDIGIGGRAGYYDGIGAARDVIQNHLLQLLALVAMEEPISFDAQDLRGREAEGALARSGCPTDLATAHRPRPVRRRLAGRREGGRLPRGGGHPAGLHHRDVRRGQARHRHPALGRRAVLPAHRQAARAAGHRDRRRVQARAAPAVRPRPPPRSSARTRWSSGSSPTRA